MILMRDIIREGNPTLTQKAAPLEFPLDDKYKKLASKMIEFLKNSQDEKMAKKHHLRPGVGLAAPQLDISKQMLAVHLPGETEQDSLSQIMINPKVIRETARRAALRDGEGCLSVDREVEGYVPRAKRITVRYYDLDGNKHEDKFRDYEAIVVQHEIDHLNGIMFYDHINPANPLAVPDNTVLL